MGSQSVECGEVDVSTQRREEAGPGDHEDYELFFAPGEEGVDGGAVGEAGLFFKIEGYGIAGGL